MKKREFNKILKDVSGKDGLLNSDKVKKLDNETKNLMINYIVRKRMPVITDLINEGTDTCWLVSMGYMELIKGKYFKYLCTCENAKYIKKRA